MRGLVHHRVRSAGELPAAQRESRIPRRARPARPTSSTATTRASLEDAYNGYKDAFDEAGYSILFDEIEDADSEVSYEGDGRTGQVALRENCEEDGRISVHITNRPE